MVSLGVALGKWGCPVQKVIGTGRGLIFFFALFLGHEAWVGTEEVEKASSWVTPKFENTQKWEMYH